jgi:hypothetical protein
VDLPGQAFQDQASFPERLSLRVRIPVKPVRRERHSLPDLIQAKQGRPEQPNHPVLTQALFKM